MICTTYGRFYCVRRILSQVMAQTYPDIELVIFNTDVDYPITGNFDGVIIVNNDVDYVTGKPYTNRGAICRDAVSHARGDYFMLADDDDVYLPWHVQQAVDRITETGKDAWKPEKSFFATPEGISLQMNTMEASVIVKMERIREIGFRTDKTGYEGLSWYNVLRDEGHINEHDTCYLPSYCFNWSDPGEVAGHKQSGDIDNVDNFENHKRASTDHATGLLTPVDPGELELFYKPFIEFITSPPHEGEINPPWRDRYMEA